MLYKYIPSQFVEDYLNGNVLFRNLTYFRQYDDPSRGDVKEGCYTNNPPEPFKITNLSKKSVSEGKYSIRIDVQTDRIFVHCVSDKLSREMFEAFGAEHCVVIRDPAEFVRRCQRAVRKIVHVDSAGCLFRKVEYYADGKETDMRRDDAREIPFLKHEIFRDQCEHRLIFGYKGSLTPKRNRRNTRMRIVINQDWNTEPDHLKGIPRSRVVKIGNIRDISDVVNVSDIDPSGLISGERPI